MTLIRRCGIVGSDCAGSGADEDYLHGRDAVCGISLGQRDLDVWNTWGLGRATGPATSGKYWCGGRVVGCDVGDGSLYGMSRINVKQAEAIENRIEQAREIGDGQMASDGCRRIMAASNLRGKTEECQAWQSSVYRW